MGVAEVHRKILRIAREQRRALQRMVPAHRAALVGHARAVQRDLERRLRSLDPTRYQSQEARVLLAQIRSVVELSAAEWGEGIGDELEVVGRVAAAIGRDGLHQQIAVWEEEFRGTVRGTARVEAAGDLLADGLLEYYQVSRETYGMEAIQRMRASMARGTLSGETTAQLTERLARDIDLPAWRAERIVRTEGSFAAGFRQLHDAADAFEGDDDWRKQLIATFDPRTGDDSYYVHEQTRRLDEPFEDDAGRSYMHPPNRPNDREVMVMVLAGMELDEGFELDEGEVDEADLGEEPAQDASPRSFGAISEDIAQAARRLEADPTDAEAQREVREGARELLGFPRAGEGPMNALRPFETSRKATASTDLDGNVTYNPRGPARFDWLSLTEALGDTDDRVRKEALAVLIHEESHALLPGKRRSVAMAHRHLWTTLEEGTAEEHARMVARSWGHQVEGLYPGAREELRRMVDQAARDHGTPMDDDEVVEWLGQRRAELLRRADWKDLPLDERFVREVPFEAHLRRLLVKPW